MKPFNKVSREHWDVKVGDEFVLNKPHHIIGQKLVPQGTKVVVEGITHFPTMYNVTDGERAFNIPVHSVK